jgi:hypothetical protein
LQLSALLCRQSCLRRTTSQKEEVNLKIKLTEVENLLLNMTSGLKPEHLSEYEKKLLEKEFGEDWLFQLGYQDNLTYVEETAKKKKLI